MAVEGLRKRIYYDRGLVDRVGNKISYLQILGVVFIVSGIGYFLLNLWKYSVTSHDVAIVFFIIMLGYSLAFPSLLKGNEGLSTMRIVVFMITNVICMLLLKIGWDADSLEKIKLDQYWVGVIAFMFGAKATQSYFESKIATPTAITRTGMAAVTYTNADIAKLALVQNEQFLKAKFPNILTISDAVHDLNLPDSHVITLYLKDNNTASIPDKLEVKMPDGTVKTIATEIIKDVGSGSIHVNQKDEIRNDASFGSVCCLVQTDNGDKKIVTAGHVYSMGNNVNYKGELSGSDITEAQINMNRIGDWFCQIIDYKTDLALASIDSWVSDGNLISFQGKDHYDVTDKDVLNTKVKIVSNVFHPQERSGYILDYNTEWDVNYEDGTVTKGQIILIGDKPNKADSVTVSQKGDSGGCVYDESTGKLIGLILGGNNKYTWVLSLKEIFEKYNYTLI